MLFNIKCHFLRLGVIIIRKCNITFEMVKAEFLSKGYIIISDESIYKNQSTRLEYICEKHPNKISKLDYVEFKRGVQCVYCRHDSYRFSYEYVYNYFKEQGCELLSDTYLGTDYKLKYKCCCGNEDEITFYNFKNRGRRCRQCSIKKKNHSGIKRYYEDIKQYIEDQGYKLLTPKEEYKNVTTHIFLQCDKGHAYKATFKNFRQHGRRCPYCNATNGEKKVEEYLKQNNLTYRIQHEFFGLIGLGGGNLRFDFSLRNDKGKIILIIEFDGIYHFEQIYEGDSYEKGQIHDRMKNRYCIENNIPLIRIPYKQFNNIENILDHTLSYFGISNKVKPNTKIINKFYVNHPDWTHENYIEKFK